MPKSPISVTLDRDNLRWLKSRAGTSRRRSVSDALDRLVTAARLGGADAAMSRSVVGTIDIAADDPDLARADAHVGAALAASLARPLADLDPPGRRPPSRRRRARA